MPRFAFNFEAIHARWPAYPANHGHETALETLCWFPEGTHFIPIDDIDQCILLIAREYANPKEEDRFSESHFHVAIWHDDLRALRDRGWLEGVRVRPTPESAIEDLLSWFDSLPPDLREGNRAALQNFDLANFGREVAEQDELSPKIVHSEGLLVSGAGWSGLESVVSASGLSLALATRVDPLLSVGAFDAAVRVRTRPGMGPGLYGNELVKKYVDHIINVYGGNGAFQRHVRAELRTSFKFIRNDFAQNFVTISAARCRAMLLRASTRLDMLDDADQGAGSLQDITVPAARPVLSYKSTKSSSQESSRPPP